MTYSSNYNRNRRSAAFRRRNRVGNAVVATLAGLILAWYALIVTAVVAGTVLLCRAAF